MSIYRSDPAPAPDSDFDPGSVHHLVPGNRGRSLDSRRTPVSVVSVNRVTATFTVRIDAFEDEGAHWEEPIEDVRHYQFAPGEARLGAEEAEALESAAAAFDRPLILPRDAAAAPATRESLLRERETASVWLRDQSVFLRAARGLPDPDTRLGDPDLAGDLERYMAQRELDDLESAFATQFVSNPHSGELVKGHRIVIAELGLVDFEGKAIRDPDLFSGAWRRDRRASHVLARLGFLRAMFAHLGVERVVLYRGMSVEGPLHPPGNRTFVSASFCRAVAESHFESAGAASARVLMEQAVPVDRVFMTYLETGAMNRQFREAEAVLFHGGGEGLF